MLVDLETAKQHLRRNDDDDDARIVRTIQQASAIVIDYLKQPAGTYTSSPDDDVPAIVQAATLLVLENLYDHPDIDPLSDAVRSILHRMRDPAMA